LVGKRIRELRTALRLSQTEFGAKLSVGRDVIGNLEYDRVSPKKMLLELMCHVFNVSREWLMEGKGEMFGADRQKNIEIAKATDILNTLSPSFRAFALRQLKEILDFQNAGEQERDFCRNAVIVPAILLYFLRDGFPIAVTALS
jgi:transcriptional regulator with XRE-family HTH domain